jgi:hypothetical protein
MIEKWKSVAWYVRDCSECWRPDRTTLMHRYAMFCCTALDKVLFQLNSGKFTSPGCRFFIRTQGAQYFVPNAACAGFAPATGYSTAGTGTSWPRRDLFTIPVAVLDYGARETIDSKLTSF